MARTQSRDRMRANMAATPTLAPRGFANAPRFFGLLFLVLFAGRLAHVGVLWVDEAYGAAAAQAMIDGRVLYRDLWFDKPPLYAWIYLLTGGDGGWLLRLLDALFALCCCALSFGLARRLWGDAKARAAALLLAFFLLFGVPSATVSLAPDLLTVPFALGAVLKLAAEGRAAWAGFVAGAALLANAKALFLLPVLLFWCWPAPIPVLAGFAGGLALTPLFLLEDGALRAYLQQVWVWGAAYSRDTPFARPVAEGVLRTANWIGFHAALILPGCWMLVRERSAKTRRLAVWFLLALLALAGGWRFYPRYYFALLPVAAVLAARGVWLIPARGRIALLAITTGPSGDPLWQAADPVGARNPARRDAHLERSRLYVDAKDAAAQLRIR